MKTFYIAILNITATISLIGYIFVTYKFGFDSIVGLHFLVLCLMGYQMADTERVLDDLKVIKNKFQI